MSTLLRAEGLTVRFGGRTLFDRLDVEVSAGERLVVRGPSGSGKTTLLRVLAGLSRPDAGSLWLGADRFEAIGGPRWRARVALLLQGAPALAASPAALADELRGYRVRQQGGWSDPAPIANRLLLDGESWRRAWNLLSGGERQRAHLALALACEPELLLLDEPTSALDPAATAAVEAELSGRTIVWVTHDRHQAERLGGRCLDLAAS